MKLNEKLLLILIVAMSTVLAYGQSTNVAYIHGDIAPDGTVPSGSVAPYDQMLLIDTGDADWALSI